MQVHTWTHAHMMLSYWATCGIMRHKQPQCNAAVKEPCLTESFTDLLAAVFLCVCDEVVAEWNKRSANHLKNVSPYSTKTERSASASMVFISGAMTKCLHQMRHIPLLVGWWRQLDRKTTASWRFFQIKMLFANITNEMKRGEMTPHTCIFCTWNAFVILMWHCGGGCVMAGLGLSRTQNAHTSFQHRNLSEVRDQCPAQWQGEGLLVCFVQSAPLLINCDRSF